MINIPKLREACKRSRDPQEWPFDVDELLDQVETLYFEIEQISRTAQYDQSADAESVCAKLRKLIDPEAA